MLPRYCAILVLPFALGCAALLDSRPPCNSNKDCDTARDWTCVDGYCVQGFTPTSSSGSTSTSSPGSSSSSFVPTRLLFVTTDDYHGDLRDQSAPDGGGITGADIKCNQDGRKRNLQGTFRAMLVDGRDRVVHEDGGISPSWVFQPRMHYRRLEPDGGSTELGMTGVDGVFRLDCQQLQAGCLEAPFSDPARVTGEEAVWTGLKDGWIVNGDNHCSHWMDSRGSTKGAQGLTVDMTTRSIDSALVSCDQRGRLVCVEQ